YATEFRHADGSTAYVYSAYNKKTVLRHFEWMRAYGLDGVFVQRFAVETVPPVNLNYFTTVLGHSREGANRAGRTYAVMYDLSGLREGETEHVIEDWKLLVNRMRIGRDSNDRAYLRHQGKPVVAVWGIGFNDDRKYTLDECAKLIDFLKNDPDFGGCTVMIGVPTYWRTLDRDCVADAKLHEVMLGADIVSPWAVGRYRDLDGVALHAEEQLGPDLEWCREHGKEYLPVVFPGFSWHNMFPDSPLNLIPRLGGQFLTKQYEAAIGAGATMVYQAMFDEVDEGTAIYKCTNDPPAGESQFVTYEGLPSDHYLKLVGQQTQCLREKLESGDAPGCYAKP
ncbi:MAG: hypothetical protein QG656_2359, partial [Candidatus Hydrogenedentes bacterium]|nr:hypothetical protein [Candidatus Hydrogenedentota bacterium]